MRERGLFFLLLVSANDRNPKDNVKKKTPGVIQLQIPCTQRNRAFVGSGVSLRYIVKLRRVVSNEFGVRFALRLRLQAASPASLQQRRYIIGRPVVLPTGRLSSQRPHNACWPAEVKEVDDVCKFHEENTTIGIKHVASTARTHQLTFSKFLYKIRR